MPITDRLLPNGIRLVTEPIAASNSAAIGFWFPAGSRDELPGQGGITHFIEHLLFKGTPGLSAAELARFFDRIGGYVNAFTERELVCLMCVVPPSNVPDAVGVMMDMITSSVFSDQDIENERSVIISEILSINDDPDETGMEAAISVIYPDNPISRPIAGTIDGVQSLSPSAIRSFYRDRFAAALPLVTAAGNIDRELLAGRLASFPHSGSGHETSHNVPRLTDRGASSVISAGNQGVPIWNAGRFARVSPFKQAQVFLSFPVSTIRTAKTWYSWAVLNAIIGDTVSSRLFQSLREKSGLCYSVYSFYLFNRDSALWTACLSTPPDKAGYAMESLVREIDLLASGGISPTELQDAKSHLVGEILLGADDTEYRMKRMARQIMFNDSVHEIERAVDYINGISDGDVSALIDGVFKGNSRCLFIYGPKKSVKECEKRWK